MGHPYKRLAACGMGLVLLACTLTAPPAVNLPATPPPTNTATNLLPAHTATPLPPPSPSATNIQGALPTSNSTPALPTSNSTAVLPTSTSTQAAAGVPRPDHVVIVIFENRSNSEIFGNACCAYINQQANASALMTQSFAVTHPSQPNYLDLFSGSNQGVTDDTCPPPGSPYSTPNLGQQLIDAGLTFAGFSEDLPATGSTVCSTSSYARKHNPWVDFTNVPRSANLPYTSFPTDFTQLPTVSFVVPNICHDMHDCTAATGDAWLKSNLDGYIQWAQTNNSLLIFTFDEDDRSESYQIVTFFEGPLVKPGQYSDRITHYHVLRTLEAMYGLPYAGQAAKVATITDIWREQPSPTP